MRQNQFLLSLAFPPLLLASSCSSDPSAPDAELGSIAPDASTLDGSANVDAGHPDPTLPPIGKELGADTYDVSLGATKNIYMPSPQTLMGSFPTALTIDAVESTGHPIPRLLVSISQNPDVVGTIKGATLSSADRGESFTPVSLDPEMGLQSAIRLQSGELYSIAFSPNVPAGGASASMVTFRSTDLGTTWTKGTASFQVPQNIKGMRFHRGIIQLHDVARTLLAPIYVSYQSDLGFRSELAQSTDNGVTWSRRGTIAKPSTTAYDETTIAQVVDGSLLALLRTEANVSPAHPGGTHVGDLAWSRSTDSGLTWSMPKSIELSFGGAAPAPRRAVDPVLALMPNGALVLSAGRDDNWVAISSDGSGATWQPALITYVNYPTVPKDANREDGSSGYTGLAPLATNRTLVFGDNCKNGPSLGCPASESGYTVDGKYRIWERALNVTSSDLGRIDLAAKMRSGLVSVSTDMSWASPKHVETRPAAALDGSVNYWSSAVRDAGPDGLPAYYIVSLDHAYDLTRVGINLRSGHADTAEIYASDDGANWTTHLASVTGGEPHYAMRSYTFASPVSARYVEVVVNLADDCGEELPMGCNMLNELELYSTLDSFDNEGVGLAPRGYDKTSLATTTADGTEDGSQALLLNDDSSKAIAVAERTTTPGPRKALEFRFLPVHLSDGFLFDLIGDKSDNGGVIYHLAFFGDGTLRQYDFVKTAWSDPLTPGGAVTEGKAVTVRLEADVTSGKLFIGAQVATVSPSQPGMAAIRGHSFGSAGTASVGGRFLIDDVLFRDL